MPEPDDVPRFRAGSVLGIVQSVDDSGEAQTLTVQTHDGVVRQGIEVMSIHGLASTPLPGAIVLLHAIEGDQTHYVAAPASLFGYRFGAVPGGGVALADAAGNRLAFPADGTGTLTVAALLTLMAQTMAVNVQGAATFTCGLVEFAGDVVFKGNVTIDGNLTVLGTINGHH